MASKESIENTNLSGINISINTNIIIASPRIRCKFKPLALTTQSIGVNRRGWSLNPVLFDIADHLYDFGPDPGDREIFKFISESL